MMWSKVLLDTVSCAPQVIPPHPARRRVYWAHFVGIACNTPTLQRTSEGGAYHSLKMVPPYRFAHPKCSLFFSHRFTYIAGSEAVWSFAHQRCVKRCGGENA